MNYFFIQLSDDLEIGSPFTLDKDECTHLFRVLRGQTGDQIGLLNGKGWIGIGQIDCIDRQSTNGKIVSSTKASPNKSEIHLVLGTLKNKAMENAIAFATQLGGVTSIHPIVCDHSEAKLEGNNDKVQKWHKVCRESCKQSKNPWIPVIYPPASFKDKWAEITVDNKDTEHVVASLHKDANPVHGWVPTGQSTYIWIGPEGDFSSEESQAFKTSNWVELSLSETTLRSETAVMIALKCVQLRKAQCKV